MPTDPAINTFISHYKDAAMLRKPKDDASYAEWDAYDTEIRLRAWSQAYQCVPNYLLTRNQKANAN